MGNWQRTKTKFRVLLPTVGIGIFVVLYFYAAHLYPGGSQADTQVVGFSWIHNYWCNLLNVEAMNGDFNPARPVAIFGMVVLCSSFGLFFYDFPNYLDVGRLGKRPIQISGIASMLLAVLIFTSLHDSMITLSSILALLPLLALFVGLYGSASFWWGIGCVVLMGINNYIYYSGQYRVALPLIQKITFALVLLWVVRLNVGFLKERPVNGLF